MKQKYTGAAVFFGCFLLLLLLVRFADVAEIGPEGTKIGLSHLNNGFHNLTGTKMFLYYLTEVTGCIAIAVAGLFAVTGLLELITRKSLLKVDGPILALGILYAVTIIFYVLFETIIINYRPVIMPGDAHVEASFPSSHTMLTFVIMGSAWLVLKKFRKQTQTVKMLEIAAIALLLITVFGRLFSGVHWFTDILAGALLGTALLFAFAAGLDYMSGKEGKPL